MSNSADDRDQLALFNSHAKVVQYWLQIGPVPSKRSLRDFDDLVI